LRDTSACSALEVDNFMRYINLLTYLFKGHAVIKMRCWPVYAGRYGCSSYLAIVAFLRVIADSWLESLIASFEDRSHRWDHWLRQCVEEPRWRSLTTTSVRVHPLHYHHATSLLLLLPSMTTTMLRVHLTSCFRIQYRYVTVWCDGNDAFT